MTLDGKVHGEGCECVRCRGFEPGTAAESGRRGGAAGVTHGARSERHLRPRAERFLERLRRTAPTAAEPADELALERLAWQLARLEALEEWLDENGLLDSRGELRSAVKQLATLDNSARRLMADLGLTWLSRRELARDDLIPIAEVQAWMRDYLTAVLALVPERRAELIAVANAQARMADGDESSAGELVGETEEVVVEDGDG